jgi:hypothetical protein
MPACSLALPVDGFLYLGAFERRTPPGHRARPAIHADWYREWSFLVAAALGLYAVWPLFMLLFADTISALSPVLKDRTGWKTVSLTAVAAISMLISGGLYVCSHERLNYANLSEGVITRSSLAALKGLSVRGVWLPQFEELLCYSEREIPRQEGLLMIPGEDLFYYSSGRHPRFPVLMFDHTVNPYSPEEILQLSRARDIRWLIVKRNLQLQEDPVEHKDRLLELLRQDFQQVESLGNYDVYRKKSSGGSSG